MKLRWQIALGCLCVLTTVGHSAVVPTQDTMVVTRSEDEGVNNSPVSPDAATTEEPASPIKLTSMEVTSEVTMRYANTAVVTHVRNPAKRAQEATFRVLLPETAFISGFVMILDGKPYKAYVKGKEEAKQIYSDAVSQGIGAAHIAAKARDSNHFTVSVNVEPNTVAVFNLTYEELLVRRNGIYNHAINLHPGALVPKLTVTVHIKESQKISQLRVPEVRTGNEIDATENDAQNSKAVLEKFNDDHEAKITFEPDLEEQRRLMDIYAEKSKESQSQVRTYSYYGDTEETKSDGILGQFVVQYDVQRPKDGEILVNDGYFVHFYAPTSLPPLSKHVVFVLDTSGSMIGRKIEQLREAMKTILSELNPGDYFNIVEFASSAKVRSLKEASEPEPPHSYERTYIMADWDRTQALPPSQATPANIAQAKVIISRLDAAGGTNIASALDVAVDLINRGVGWTQQADATTEVTSTERKPGSSKEFVPIIIFLTDGDPTVGETNPKRIINHLSEKNYGENKASIFSLAFGEDADRKFLRKLSLRNDGFMRHIYEAADAVLQLRDFYRQVSSPLLADVKFAYPPEQLKEGSLTKHKFRTFYAGSEAVVAGRIADSVTELAPRVTFVCGVDDDFIRKQVEISPKAPVAVKKEGYLPLERLWAYLTIKQLLDQRDAADEPGNDKEDGPEKKALELALKYSFVTPLTSLVVVKPNATNAVDAESVDKQSGSQFVPAFGAPGIAGVPASLASHGAAYAAHSKISNMQPSFAYSSALHGFSNAAMPLDRNVVFTDRGTSYRTDIPIALMVPSTTPLPADIHLTSAASTASPGPLEAYHLQDYQWAAPLLNASIDALVIQVNGSAVTLKLTKDVIAPKTATGDTECILPSKSEPGVCVYLTRCSDARSLTAHVYSDIAHCFVGDGYAGVCCHKTKLDQQTTE